MPAPHVVVRDTRMAQHDLALVPKRLERQGYYRFDPLGSFRHPGVLHPLRAFDPNEAPVMGPYSSLVLHRKIEQAVHHGLRITRSAPYHGPPGLLVSIQTSNTSSLGAGIKRVTVISISFILISSWLRRTPPVDPGGHS